MGSNILIQFRNCRLVRDHQIIDDDLWVRNGKIIDPEKVFFDEKTEAHQVIDCDQAIIAPGFIDIQINGGLGVDFSTQSNNIELGIERVAKWLLSHGVTSFCPTLVTSPKQIYEDVLSKIRKRPGNRTVGATILGVHLEGPFINMEKKGAHPEKFIRELSNGMETLKETYSCIENVKIITLAPEMPNAMKVIKELTEKYGISVAIGHSMANVSVGEEAIKHGCRLITHLFNAMLPFHHRDPGLVGLLTSDTIRPSETIYFGIISDGVHTHPAALRIAHRTNPSGLILISDAISAMGLRDGVHNIGQMSVECRDGKAFIAGTTTLCGSIDAMDECVRIFQRVTDCSTVYALEAASLHPAKCLGIDDRKGTLRFGGDADLVFLDDRLNVLSTWIAGDCVWKKGI